MTQIEAIQGSGCFVLIYFVLFKRIKKNKNNDTYLTCKEVSADLHYDLVVLVRRLVPGHHHIRTGHVLQLVYLF